MKWLKRILISLLILIAAVSVSVYIWLNSSAPEYSGEFQIPGLHSAVDVYFDDYGIPHIYAADKHDLYKAFGYVHAQDRLFQMEMLRRAGSGRLAEIIGKPMIKVDRMFLSLGLTEYASESAAYFETLKGTPIHDDVMAYLDGINTFITSGPTPPEFSIIGIEKRPFTVEDLYYITGAMSFSFSQAQKTEPVIDFISKQYGDAYLADMGLWHDSSESYIPSNSPATDFVPSSGEVPATAALIGKQSSPDISLMMAERMTEVEQLLPMAPLQGSNSWVVAGDKTESGEVIFCNDTHIGYLLPQTWYEAHLNAPDFEMYGHFMSGIPFALVGRNRQLAWGLTMLLNDDMDFYYEKANPSNPDEFLFGDHYDPCKKVSYTIKVKGGQDTTINVRVTRHGPVINDAFEDMGQETPVSMYWTYTKMPNRNIDALYGLNNSTNMSGFSSHLSKIHAPGLSINYGDRAGNIAWWASASLLRRAPHVNSWTILDGSDPANENQGFYPFDNNPRCINPAWGYVYSANDWPQAIDAGHSSDSLKPGNAQLWYPGYYKPQYRADRIRKLLSARSDWSMDRIRKVMTDHKSDADSALAYSWYQTIVDHKPYQDSAELHDYLPLLLWDGQYDPINPSPTFFNRMLYHYLHDAMADELGEKRFDLFLQTHQLQRTQVLLDSHHNSQWWDDKHTDVAETREIILFNAFCKTISDCRKEFGDNPAVWTWRKTIGLELKHPLGEVAFLRPFFNVGPEEVSGGNETIMQSGYKLDSTGHYKVFFGSQMRIIVDFANVDSAINITPCGQSGHVMSKHYDDQSELYRKMAFRPQWMDYEKIKTFSLLRLVP